MRARYIDANALIDYANNQIDQTITANDIARFPTAIDVKWHYPSKGDYPPSMEKYCGRSEPVLVWLGDNNVEYAQWIEGTKTWGRGICELTGTVIAWKYIELPEEM